MIYYAILCHAIYAICFLCVSRGNRWRARGLPRSLAPSSRRDLPLPAWRRLLAQLVLRSAPRRARVAVGGRWPETRGCSIAWHTIQIASGPLHRLSGCSETVCGPDVALQDEPRRSTWSLGPGLVEDRPNTDPKYSGQTAFTARLSSGTQG